MSRKTGVSRTGSAPPDAAQAGGKVRGMTGRIALLDLSEAGAYRPPSDVTEVDDAVKILLEVPGVPPDALQVWVRGDCIEVTGEKPPEFPSGETSFLCLERIFGRFRRVFEVVGCLNLGEVSARLSEGLLVITIPKIVERRGRERRIPVTTG